MQFLCRKKERKIICHLPVAEPRLHASRVPVCGAAVHSCLAFAATSALLLSSSLWDWNTFNKKLLGGSFFTHDAVKFCKFKLMCFPLKHTCIQIKTKYKNYFKVFALSYKKELSATY